jgi:subtilisin family serine protease
LTSAQRQTPEEAFTAKANHVLKAVRMAANTDRAAVSQGNFNVARSEVRRLSKVAAVDRGTDGTVSVRTAVELTQNDDSELIGNGFALGARIGDVVTVTTDVDRLPELAALSSVGRISAAIYRHPRNDRARQAIGVDNSSGQRVFSQTGAGVVVGIIDTGIDFRHLDFTIPGSGGRQTRIKAMLDMTYYGTSSSFPPDPGWNYTLPGSTAAIGHLYTEADINAALQESPKPAQSADVVKERDKAGHGTHVAGTAAGNGLSSPTVGTYDGMAPEADLIIVKASRENDGNDDFGLDDIVNGLAFIQQKASELGEPFVVNMSLGGQGGTPHDGTDPDERAIDNLVNSGTGRAVCVAAGNEGEAGMHASGSVTQGSDVPLTFTDSSNPNSLTLYYPNADRFSLTVTMPNGATLNSGAFNGNPTSNQYLTIYNGTDDKQDSDPSNDQSSLFIVFDSGAETLGSTWRFTLHGNSVTAGGAFNAWVDEDNGSFSAPYLDDSKEVASPGTSRGAITVGAYVTRSASQTIGDFAYFTSPGPTADLRQKPDLSTAGYYLYSARSTDMTAANASFGTIGSGSNAPADSTHYIGFAGTSMATAVATGAVALLMQANSNLLIDQIKEAIFSTATHDNFTGSGWEPHFGVGKLNIAAALNSLALPTNPIDDPRSFVRQHYLDFLSREPDQGGWDYWTNQITSCGSDQLCVNARRIAVSDAFFFEQEFQDTGAYVYRIYKAAFGLNPTFAQFQPDRAQVVGGSNLDQGKAAFALAFVQRDGFVQVYPRAQTGDQFVDAMLGVIRVNSGVDLSSIRPNLIASYDGTDNGRAVILRQVADNQAFIDAEYNRSFVLNEYFGYLRRDPEQGGYDFWLGQVNRFPIRDIGIQHAMVCSFITSVEYQVRFGSAVTHTNSECPQ